MNAATVGRRARVVVRAALAVLAILVLSGCRLVLGVDIDLDGDGGGSMHVVVEADAALEQATRDAGVDPLGRMVERVRSLDDGWRVADEVDDGDGSRIVTLTSRFADPAEFAARYGQIASALDAPEAQVLGPLRIVVDEESDTVGVDGTLAVLVTEVAAADLGTDVATLTAQLDDVVEARVSVHTPGTPLQTDGSVMHDDPEAGEGAATVTWTAAAGTQTPVSLVAERGGSMLLTFVLIGGGGILALLLVLGGVLAQRRR